MINYSLFAMAGAGKLNFSFFQALFKLTTIEFFYDNLNINPIHSLDSQILQTNVMNIPSKKLLYSSAHAIAIVLFLTTYVVDASFYDDENYRLLMVRVVVSIMLTIGFSMIHLLEERWLDYIATSMGISAGLAITSICYFSGDGFDCMIFVGYFILIIVFSTMFYIKPMHYSLVMLSTIIFHFTLLSTQPYQKKYLILQICTIPSVALVGMVNQYLIYSFFVKNRVLEQIAPLCSRCRKIKNADGNWEQLDKFVNKEFGSSFKHEICPDCEKSLYGKAQP